MNESLISRIWHFLFGYKYYSIISYAVGTPRCAIHAILNSRKEAKQLLDEISASFKEVEIVTFRSKNKYVRMKDKNGVTYWYLAEES